MKYLIAAMYVRCLLSQLKKHYTAKDTTHKFSASVFSDTFQLDGVKLTTVYPCTINTSMVYGATSRFPWFIPVTQPRTCAETIIDAIQKEETEVIVPRHLDLIFKLFVFVPRKARMVILKFLDVGVAADEI